MVIILIEASIAVLCIIIFLLIDGYITHKNISINQKEWDEYSKGMTNQEKINCFGPWLLYQKNKHNWRYFYIPWIGLEGDEDDD